MAREVYDPRTIMLSRGLTAGDVAKRARGKVGCGAFSGLQIPKYRDSTATCS